MYSDLSDNRFPGRDTGRQKDNKYSRRTVAVLTRNMLPFSDPDTYRRQCNTKRRHRYRPTTRWVHNRQDSTRCQILFPGYDSWRK